jgi:hypothetical protein
MVAEFDPTKDIQEHSLKREAFYSSLVPAVRAATVLDPSGVLLIDEFAEIFFSHLENETLAGVVYPATVGEKHRQEWLTTGFHEPAVRSVVLNIMENTGLLTDINLKYFVTKVFKRHDLICSEYEAVSKMLAEETSPGILQTKENAVKFLDYLADNSGEMKGKRPISFMVNFNEFPSEMDVSSFLASDDYHELCLFGTIDWFCNSRKERPFRYEGLCREALIVQRQSEAYQQYDSDPYKFIERKTAKYLRA